MDWCGTLNVHPIPVFLARKPPFHLCDKRINSSFVHWIVICIATLVVYSWWPYIPIPSNFTNRVKKKQDFVNVICKNNLNDFQNLWEASIGLDVDSLIAIHCCSQPECIQRCNMPRASSLHGHRLTHRRRNGLWCGTPFCHWKRLTVPLWENEPWAVSMRKNPRH